MIMSTSNKTESIGEFDLTKEQKAAYQELLDDYKAATVLVPGYHGGLSRKIAVALIQGGWRKQPN